ncbi:MAG: RNA ligase family protein [Verrucomicrobiales bacterium]
MGASRDDFIKYPRTPHLFGSKGTDDDKHLGPKDSAAFISDPSLIVEEKLDGTNVGIHFTSRGRMVLQCRGHEITEGMHPQYDLFKQWTSVMRPKLESLLEGRFILYGEWLYAKHSIHYRALAHYFFEFDIYDKDARRFLDFETRMTLLSGTGIVTVPVVHQGAADLEKLQSLVGPSAYRSEFDNPLTGLKDNIMEGLYLRTERNGFVSGRAKWVRPEFTEKVKQSDHWKSQIMVANALAEGVDIWSGI